MPKELVIKGSAYLIWSKVASWASKLYVFLNKSKISFSDKMPEEFTITCHSGALFTSDNTLQSVRTAVEWGAQIVEFDVSFRPSGTPVIIHAAAPEENKGVLLKDALAIVAKSKTCKINLDIKSMTNLGAVDELVKLYGLEKRVFYTGVFEDWVETVRSNSSIPYYLNYNVTKEETEDSEAIQNIADLAKALGAIGINSNFVNANEDFVDIIRQNGLLVSLWTVNKIEDMSKVLKLKPDNITTRNPAILKEIL